MQCRQQLEQGAGLLQRGQLREARSCFERALEADRREAIAYNCLGIVARLERRHEEAIRRIRQAIVLRPQFAEAHNNLGNVWRDKGALEDAEVCYRHALKLKPQFPEAHNNLGVVCLARGAVDESIRCFEAAISLQPQYAEAYNNLANAFSERGELLDAAACLRSALQICPTSPDLHTNLGNILAQSSDADEARKCFQRALELDPDFAPAHVALGNLLVDADQLESAIDRYQLACRTCSATADHFVNLGNVLRLAGQFHPARSAYIQAAALEPSRISHQLRVSGLCPAVFPSRDEMQDAKNRALREWQKLADAIHRIDGFRLHDDLPEPSFNWQFLDRDLRELKEAYARIFVPAAASMDKPVGVNRGRPRIGVVVSKGHEGLFVRSMRGVLNRLRLDDVDLTIVALGASEQLSKSGFVDSIRVLALPQSIKRAAEPIRECRFDIIYYWEIGTDPCNYFLPFLRLAPVQCTSWGIQVTSGIPNVDFYLSSRLVEPQGADAHYSEKLLLASTLLTFQERPTPPQSGGGRESFGFHAGQHLYVCAQQPGKFHPDFDSILAAILEADPRGVIVAVGDRYGYASELLGERLLRTIGTLAKRVQFVPRPGYTDYLRLLNAADVLLDPPHFGGVNSTYDALAMNQPVVSCPSGYHRGEYTAGCYRRMGMQELIAANSSEYVAKAVRLATEPDYRLEIGRELAERTNLLFEDHEAVAEHERLFRELIQIARRTGVSQA